MVNLIKIKRRAAPAINNILPVRTIGIFVGEQGNDQYGGYKNENTCIVRNCAPYIRKGKRITKQILSVYFRKTIIRYIVDHIVECRYTNDNNTQQNPEGSVIFQL